MGGAFANARQKRNDWHVSWEERWIFPWFSPDGGGGCGSFGGGGGEGSEAVPVNDSCNNGHSKSELFPLYLF